MKLHPSLLCLVSATALCLLAGMATTSAQTNNGNEVRFTQGTQTTFSTIALPPGAGFAVTNDADNVVTFLPFQSGSMGPSLTWSVIISGVTNTGVGNPFPASFPPALAGLATVTATNTGTFPGFLTVKIEKPLTNTVHTAQGTVVIPSDAGGPVRIFLESSTDMITWNEANPGTYGTSTTNRFFRLRATR